MFFFSCAQHLLWIKLKNVSRVDLQGSTHKWSPCCDTDSPSSVSSLQALNNITVNIIYSCGRFMYWLRQTASLSSCRKTVKEKEKIKQAVTGAWVHPEAACLSPFNIAVACAPRWDVVMGDSVMESDTGFSKNVFATCRVCGESPPCILRRVWETECGTAAHSSRTSALHFLGWVGSRWVILSVRLKWIRLLPEYTAAQVLGFILSVSDASHYCLYDFAPTVYIDIAFLNKVSYWCWDEVMRKVKKNCKINICRIQKLTFADIFLQYF